MILRVGKHNFLYIHRKKTPIVSYFHRKHSLSKYILRHVLSQLAIPRLDNLTKIAQPKSAQGEMILRVGKHDFLSIHRKKNAHSFLFPS